MHLRTSLEMLPPYPNMLEDFHAQARLCKKLTKEWIRLEDMCDLIEKAIQEEPPISDP